MKIRKPMAFHSKPENVPGYAECPHHGSEGIYFNNVTRFYQCQAATEPGDAGYSPTSTFNGQGICHWQKSQPGGRIDSLEPRHLPRRPFRAARKVSGR